MMIIGKEKTLAFRKLFLLNALRTEIDTNRRLTNKVPSAYSIIKKEYKLTGNKENVYRQFFFKLVDEKILDLKS